MTNTPSDRVQVRQIGDLMHPGACALCGNGTCDRGYVDLDIYFDYEGQIYLCWNCAEQVVETLGGLLPEQALHLKEVSEEIAKKNRELEEENANLRSKLDSWYTMLDGAIDFRSDDSVNEQVDQSSEPAGSGPNAGTVSESGSGEPVTKKPTPKRRPHDASRTKQRNSPVL